MTRPSDPVSEAVSRIAESCLHIDTLAIRKSDALDFHTLAVWQIRQALFAAYESGREAQRLACPDTSAATDPDIPVSIPQA